MNHLTSCRLFFKTSLFFFVITFMATAVHSQDNGEYPNGIIERFDPKLDAIIKKDAKVDIIADRFTWVEGPVWVEREKMLLVSDVFKNRVYKWTKEKGKELYLEPSGYTQAKARGKELGSNGLVINRNGQLLLCQHGDRRLALLNSSIDQPRPAFITVADKYKGKKLNSPNDLVVKSNGDIYFTDPPYGLEKGMNDPEKELPFQGVYRVSKDGRITLLIDSLSRPNGIAFFPGEKSLIVANSDPRKPHWYIYDLDSEGLLINGRIFYNGAAAFKKEQRTPDGLKIDKNGNVFAPGPGGVWIFDKSGNELGRIKLNVVTSNCAFANNDKTLFITADKYLLKIDLR